jgi:hypothetical protein
MANELTIGLNAAYEDSVGIKAAINGLDELIISLATAKVHHTKQNVATSEEAVGLGDISSRGLMILINRDPTNYIEVKVATGGAIFAKLFNAGSTDGINWCVVHLGSGAQSPFVIANTGACEMEIFLLAL